MLIVPREREVLVSLADIHGFILERDNGMISLEIEGKDLVEI